MTIILHTDKPTGRTNVHTKYKRLRDAKAMLEAIALSASEQGAKWHYEVEITPTSVDTPWNRYEIA